jgi:hypothetical protein
MSACELIGAFAGKTPERRTRAHIRGNKADHAGEEGGACGGYLAEHYVGWAVHADSTGIRFDC